MSMAVNALAVSSCGRWLATADEAGWLQVFTLETLAACTSATSDHAAARQRPNPAAGAIGSLAFGALTARDAAIFSSGGGSGGGRQQRKAAQQALLHGDQGMGSHRLVCDTGHECCVFDVMPRASGGTAVRLERVGEGPRHDDQVVCVGWLPGDESGSDTVGGGGEFVVSTDMSGAMRLWRPD
jgi:hypothetical protein